METFTRTRDFIDHPAYDQQRKIVLKNLSMEMIDPAYIQFGCADWFWKQYKNSFVLQVEPEQHMYFDRCTISPRQAVQVETARNRFFDHLEQAVRRLD